MIKCVLWLLLTFGFVIHPRYNAVPIVVNDIVFDAIINDEFEDGTEAESINVSKEDEGPTYLVRQGADEKGNCHISRTELKSAEIAGYKTYLMPVGGITETCTGVGCTFCGFKKSGGCECRNVSGHCTHTISRNSDMIRIF